MAKRGKGKKKAPQKSGGLLKGLRIQKRIKMARFLWVNVSKSGVSFSFGRRGLWLNIGKGGTNLSVSAPGTGVSYRRKLSWRTLTDFLQNLLGEGAPEDEDDSQV